MIKFDTSHLGDFKHNAEEFPYKTIVISGPIQGDDRVRFGYIIQIRKKSGVFGSDTILLREADGLLHSFSNVSFFSVAEEYLPLYEEELKASYDLDKEGYAYNIQGRNTAIGYVIFGYDDVNHTIDVEVRRRQQLSELI